MGEDKKTWANQYVHTCLNNQNGYCNACYQEKYKSENRGSQIIDLRARYHKNKEEINKKRREKYRADPKVREKIKERARKGYSANKHLPKNKRTTRSGRSSSRQDYREMVISFIIKRDGNICSICHNPLDMGGDKITIDHIIEVFKGGTNDSDNVRLAHRSCNFRRPRIDYRPHNYDNTL